MDKSSSLDASSPGYSRVLLKNMFELWEDKLFCDITILIGKRRFSAHRNVLASASPFFKAMFTSGMEEQNQSEISLHDVSWDIFSSVLCFMYSGSLHIDVDTCQDILSVADMLGIEDLVEICGEFLIQNMTTQNCVGIYAFSDAHTIVSVKRKSKMFLDKNFIAAFNEEEFAQVDLGTVLSILGSEKLHIERESQVLEAAMKWLLYDLPARRTFSLQVFNEVRIRLVSHRLLFKILETCNDHGTKMLLLKFASRSETMDTLNPLGQFSSISSLNSCTQPRLNARTYTYLIGGFSRLSTGLLGTGTITTLNCIERYDTHSKSWTSFNGMCNARSSFGAAVFDRKIVVAGGEDASLISASVEAFDPDENMWVPWPSMNYPRYGLSLIAAHNCLFAIGGYVGTQIDSSLECYNQETNSWEVVDNMPYPRFSFAAVEYEGLIYIVGGLSELYSELDMTESYNPITKEWCTLAKMQQGRAHHGVVAHDGFLYAVGGFHEYQGSLCAVERYSIAEDKWEIISSMKIRRAGAGVSLVDDKIYVFGGRYQEMDWALSASSSVSLTLDSSECYDIAKDSWSDLPKMSYKRCETMSIVL